ncbi:MAG: hypothetical protein AUK48_02235 [Oscillatoriales cyanobacterium CG2_30_44_21]|nr:MAG: hypothetical protein AUK48_02235 [Oscillatoriales cyanobacterium CG2_30_44_21]
MKSSPQNSSPLQNIFAWVKNTPERSIDRAFEAAVNIKKIEEESFNNNKIYNNGGISENVFSVFEIQLQKNISNIKTRLNFYKASASLPYLQPQNAEQSLNNPNAKYAINDLDNDPVGNGQLSANQLRGNAKKFSIYQKLAFIDYTLDRYNPRSRTIDVPAKPPSDNNSAYRDEEPEPLTEEKFQLFRSDRPKGFRRDAQLSTSIEKSILPGSFFKAFDRVKRNLSGSYTDYEKDIVEELRQSRERIKQASRYIAVLVVAVIAVHFLSKILIFSPLINSLTDTSNMSVKFSPAIEERAFEELRIAKERIEFKFTVESFLQKKNQVEQEKVLEKSAETESERKDAEKLIQEESIRILKKYNQESLNGVKNLLADIAAAFVFYLFLISGREELMTIKEFLDEVLYSLNDNAKAFLIIISTDTFVGFHSSEGWDALLTVIFQHFGLPENRILAQSFISTVPVFLDGLFKFWIFQYLTQASPSTATIYREMNE